MIIVLISTFLQKCGIATYTEALAPAIRALGHDVVVLAEAESTLSGEASPTPYFRTWHRGSFQGHAFARTIINAKIKTDIAHFQHEHGIFPNSAEFLIACRELRKAKIKVFVTLHTVHAPPVQSAFIKELIHAVDKVIVHTSSAAAQIAIQPYGVTVIPHGVRLNKFTPNHPSSPFLCPGFISGSKGHEEILRGYAKFIDRQQTNLLPGLSIVGLCRDFLYAQSLEQTINNLGLEGHVTIINKYLSDEALIAEVHDARAIILGAKGPSSPYSASGQMAIAIGCGKPVIAKNVPIYNNTTGITLFNNPEELANLLRATHLIDTEEATLVAQSRSWPNVAKKHVQVYENCYT